MWRRFPLSLLLSVYALVALLPATPAQAQTPERVEVTQDASVFRRPATDSEVRATVAAGAVLEVLDRQEGWLAVSTPEGVIGWIETSLTKPATAEARPAPSPTPDPRPAPPESPPSTSTDVPPPPPPPARPPGRSGDSPSTPSGGSDTNEVTTGGLYGSGGWSRLEFTSTDGTHPGGGITWSAMLSEILEFRNQVRTVRRAEGPLPGIDFLGDPRSVGNFATEENTVWDMGISGALSVYLRQPDPALPLGLYLGGFGDFTRFFGGLLTSPDDFNTLSYGGQAGVYYRGRSGNVVRGEVQIGRIQYRSVNEPVTESLTNVEVGIEPRIRSFQIGAYAGTRNDEPFLKFAFIFR